MKSLSLICAMACIGVRVPEYMPEIPDNHPVKEQLRLQRVAMEKDVERRVMDKAAAKRARRAARP